MIIWNAVDREKKKKVVSILFQFLNSTIFTFAIKFCVDSTVSARYF